MSITNKKDAKVHHSPPDQNTSPSAPRSLAIIPCYNEEATVGCVVEKTKPYVDAVVVVDDGSTDQTAEIATNAGAVVLCHESNKGKGAALKTGFQFAVKNKFDFVVTIDGDGQHNPDEIPAVLEKVMTNDYDISIGFRVGHNTEMPTWRRVGKRVLDYTTSLGTGGFVTDSQCGFRAFNKRAVATITPKLRGSAFSIESEQLIRAYESGFKVVNTNITCRYKNLQTSTKNPASHGLSVLSSVLWIVARQRALLVMGVFFLFFLMIGLAMGINIA
ncbi:MAG: glycosyltransferase family 2 protein [Candidatus Thermoplasmatota archaeon]|nr:glycosyltransferase family 2 protein [Candidatus Thermoplasmatota archaeon]